MNVPILQMRKMFFSLIHNFDRAGSRQESASRDHRDGQGQLPQTTSWEESWEKSCALCPSMPLPAPHPQL